YRSGKALGLGSTSKTIFVFSGQNPGWSGGKDITAFAPPAGAARVRSGLLHSRARQSRAPGWWILARLRGAACRWQLPPTRPRPRFPPGRQTWGRSAHTPNVTPLLRQLGASLLVTTYAVVLPLRFPDLINDEKLLASSFVVPTERLGEVAATVRASGPER